MVARIGFGIIAFAALVLLLAGFAPARADEARRCGPDGCSYIHCSWSGDHCFREDNWAAPVEDVWAGDVYSGRFLVCDPEGDRCYGSERPWWNYRAYYRRYGYEWLDDDRGYDRDGGYENY